jgi:hypothetical protein
MPDFLDSPMQIVQDFFMRTVQFGGIFTQQEQDLNPAPVSLPAPTQLFTVPQYSSNQFVDYNEIENRCLLITNMNPETEQNEVLYVFNADDCVRQIDWSKLDQGQLTIEYFDLRQANQMRRLANGITMHGNVILVTYAPLAKIDDPRRPPNNGTVVVFHLPTGISSQQIENIFGQFGEIRQIRGTPTKPTQRFIEYWDIRGAEAALNGLTGKYVMGSRVSIEFSLPGGFRRNMQRSEQSSPPESKYMNK